MTTKRWVWTRHRKNLRSMLTATPGEGFHTPESLKQWLKQLRSEAAKNGRWRTSELVMAIASDNEEVDEIARRMGLTSESVSL